MNKIKKSLLTLCIVFGVVLASKEVSLAKPFPDITRDAWYREYTEYVSDAGIMTGKGDGNFSPRESINRAEAVTTLARLSSQSLPQFKQVFDDIQQGAWYAPYVVWAYNTGVSTGYKNGSFGPSNNVSREQFVTMLYRFNQIFGGIQRSSEIKNVYLGFSDGKTISDYAREAADWAIYFGILQGKAGNLYDPRASLSRAEASAILTRYMKLRNKETVVTKPASGWISTGPVTLYKDPATGKYYDAGVHVINGTPYLFDQNGFLCKKDGHTMVGGRKYWSKSDGTVRSGWHDYNGQMLYFSKHAYAAYTDCMATVDGMKCVFNSDGIAYNYIRVGKNKKWTTIRSAIDTLASRYPEIRESSVNPILAYIGIDAGTYNESICLNYDGETAYSGIRFEGTGNVTWVTDVKYPDGPLFSNGTNTFQNISFKATGTEQIPAYAYHYEGGRYPNIPEHATEVIFDNCRFESAGNSAVGIGSAPSNTHIRFQNCAFVNKVFFHNSVNDGNGNNYIVFDRCTGPGVSVHDSAMMHRGVTTQLDVLFINNKFSWLSFSNTPGGTECISYIPASSRITINNQSTGNTATVMNKK